MGFMDNVSAFTKGVGQKAKGNYDILSLNNQISNVEKEKDGLCKELGWKYYIYHKGDPEESLSNLVFAIAAKEEQIETLRKEVEATREATAAVSLTYEGNNKEDISPQQMYAAAGDVSLIRRCSNCGAPIIGDDMFCGTCGAKQEVPMEVDDSSNIDSNNPFNPDDTVESEAIADVAEPVKLCKQCGATLDIDAEFCGVCGSKVEV